MIHLTLLKLYNRRVCVYIYLDYQQQTSRSIIVQCDLEKK